MRGYPVSIPLTDSQDYDIVVEVDGVLKKVQVKTGSKVSKEGAGIFFMSVQGGNKTASTCKLVSQQVWDYFFGFHLETKKVIFIPKEKITGNTQLNMGEKYKEWIHSI